ncbi:MAG TPA: hypothetical protein PK129_10810, partial [Cellvibrionaceae bacterium]|nr:hypothetical protein [Cellvibrionaceae bacterium]
MKTILFALFCVVCLNACSTVQSQYQYQVIYPNTDHVKFTFLTTRDLNGSTQLQGSLFHKPKSPVRESGHIDMAIYSPDGKLLGQTVAHYKMPINGNYEWSRTGVRFFAPLGITPPLGSTIKLAFHVVK